MEAFSAIFAIFSAYGVNFLLGIIVAPLIYADARKLPVLFLNTKPWFWAVCAVFLGPLWTVLVYWAIHHSSFSNREGINSGGHS
ncbi:hypothetical protein [Thalassolituus sp.]|jgi:prolipoprotein diacylglyceryltransferase|uniref:hypothetical protein n=1 Tax=Thalassolituus sp. TaxID=2030822 RepID=UPI002440C50D|nr:hypothetical protein [Thalassolituus sp.]